MCVTTRILEVHIVSALVQYSHAGMNIDREFLLVQCWDVFWRLITLMMIQRFEQIYKKIFCGYKKIKSLAWFLQCNI